MASINSWQNMVGESMNDILFAAIDFVPVLLGAATVFFVGIIISNWAKTVIVKTLQLIKFENMIKDSKFKKFLVKAEITKKVEEILGTLVKWILTLTFLIASLNILGLSSISLLLTSILAYIPSVIAAVVVLAIGVLLAGLVEGFVKGALASVDLKTSRLMGKIASYIVIIMAALVAVSELHIAQNFINILFVGFITMLSLGLALAIGLGSKDLVAKVLGDWHKNLSKELKKK